MSNSKEDVRRSAELGGPDAATCDQPPSIRPAPARGQPSAAEALQASDLDGSEPVAGRVRIDVRVAERADRDELEELASALQSPLREIPSKYFYDELGSKLFERICEQPEYYPYLAERQLLADRSDEIVERTDLDVLVEIGSGASTKTRFLLDAMRRADRLHRYVPVDISSEILERVALELAAEYPELEVLGLVEDFVREPGGFPSGGRRLIAFLGGTIGNFQGQDASRFLAEVAAEMGPDDFLLLGTDLIKDPAILEAAYNDAAGVTAEFNKNILRVVNERAQADFDPARFRHRAFFDSARHRIELRLVALEEQTVNLKRLPLELHLDRGEEIRTEVSTKFDRDLVRSLLQEAGLELEAWLPDSENRYALSLSRLAGR